MKRRLELLRRFLRMDSVSENTNYLFPEIIRLHQVNQVKFRYPESGLKRINPSMLNQSARKYMVELLVDRHAYQGHMHAAAAIWY